MSRKKDELELLSCPGDTIAEWMEEGGFALAWLAERLELSRNKTRALLMGEYKIYGVLAKQLEEVTSIPAHFWINSEKLYRDKLEKIKRL